MTPLRWSHEGAQKLLATGTRATAGVEIRGRTTNRGLDMSEAQEHDHEKLVHTHEHFHVTHNRSHQSGAFEHLSSSHEHEHDHAALRHSHTQIGRASCRERV